MQNSKESGERSFQDEAGFPCGHMPPPHRDALKRRFLPRMNDGGLRATSDEEFVGMVQRGKREMLLLLEQEA